MGDDDKTYRILVVKLADLGDLLLIEPALRSIRGAFPAATIDLLVPPSSAALARMIAPDVSVLPFSKQAFDDPRVLLRPREVAQAARLALRLRRSRYHRVVLLHHLTTVMGARKFRALALATGSSIIAGIDNGRGTFLTHRVDDLGFGARHEVDYALETAISAGGVRVDRRPQIAFVPVSQTFGMPKTYIAMFPATGGFSTARTWSIQSFIEVARALRRRGDEVVILGGNDARAHGSEISEAVPDTIDLTGRTSLEQLAAIVGGARAVVGGDSFIGHLADALDRPLVVVFGPSNIDAWGPVSSVRVSGSQPIPAARAIALDADVSCSPCLYTGFSLGRRMGCPARTCLKLVTPARVIEALDAVLAAEDARHHE